MIRRLLSMALVLWLAATIAFFALRILPGDAIEAQLTQSGAGAETIALRRAELGLDAPLWVQYGQYLSGLLRGDLGYSLLSGQPVSEMIAQQLAPTASLALLALGWAVGLGLLLGSMGAVKIGGGLSTGARLLINLALSTPLFWTGSAAILIFSVWLDLLPSAGGGRWSQLVLPVGVLGFHTAGSIGRVTQVGIRTLYGADFVRTARAKGVSEIAIIAWHILPAAVPPLIAVIALQAGFLLGGTVITESMFVRPGIGRLLLDSTLRQDYPVVQGIVLLAALSYTLLNAAADFAQGLADPRLS